MRNADDLQLTSDVCMQTCDTVAKCAIPCACNGNFKKFKVYTSEFGTMSMCRGIFRYVTEGVVHGVYKVVIQSCFQYNTAT